LVSVFKAWYLSTLLIVSIASGLQNSLSFAVPISPCALSQTYLLPVNWPNREANKYLLIALFTGSVSRIAICPDFVK
jgi:hypothetical protein